MPDHQRRCPVVTLMWACQVLPFASEATLSQLEANIAGCPSVTDMLHEGSDARGITARILAGLGVMDQGFSLTPRYAITGCAVIYFAVS